MELNGWNKWNKMSLFSQGNMFLTYKTDDACRLVSEGFMTGCSLIPNVCLNSTLRVDLNPSWSFRVCKSVVSLGGCCVIPETRMANASKWRCEYRKARFWCCRLNKLQMFKNFTFQFLFLPFLQLSIHSLIFWTPSGSPGWGCGGGNLTLGGGAHPGQTENHLWSQSRLQEL